MSGVGAAWVSGLLLLAACEAPGAVASDRASSLPAVGVFDVDSATVSCVESVDVELAMRHATAAPGYLECLTSTILQDGDGTDWLCRVVATGEAAGCMGPRLLIRGIDPSLLPIRVWHSAGNARWADPVMLLGRVRFD